MICACHDADSVLSGFLLKSDQPHGKVPKWLGPNGLGM
jgi:hypothetical protein